MRISKALSLILLILLVAGALGAADATADQAVWNQFLSWYKTYSGPPFMPDVIKAYTQMLTAGGADASTAAARLEVVKKMAGSASSEFLSVHFDNIYARQTGLFIQEHSPFLERAIQGVKPGKALDVGMGQGRNTIFLARQGWDATGYDLSDGGMAQARAAAEKAGLKISTVHASHSDFDFGKERWDLIVMTYSLANLDDRAFLARIRDSLRPGGRVVVEQMNSGGPGPGPANALFRSFEDLRVLSYEDTQGVAEWGKMPARIGRIVAQKD